MSRFDPTRRRLLIGAGGLLAAGATGCRALLGRYLSRYDNSGFAPVSYSFEDTDQCLMTVEAIEGPYFIERTAVRSDIREGRPGVPLTLKLKVVRGDGCTPVAGALVEVWHCDALGVYSGYMDADPDLAPFVSPGTGPLPPRDESRFLRGIQTSDADGMVSFQTIVPGWYAPRVQHVHVKVFVEEGYVLTSQLYFPDDLIAEVERLEPYRQRGPSPYTRRNDVAIHESQGADGGWLRISGDASSVLGSVTLGIPG
jgi:protocatechuate 3,4-dioxygenase beta subunit